MLNIRFLQKLGRSFRKSQQGVAAIEFAILAPILILLFVGTLEISLAVAVDRKVSRVSSSIADLITQSNDLSSNEVDEILDVANRIMQPYDDDISISVVGVEIKDDEAKVVWACQRNGGGKPSVGSDYTIPAQIMVNDTFLVSATVATSHEPAFKFIGYKNGKLTFDETAIEMEEQMFLRPRLGSSVEVTGC
ncbi:MAG: TadE/TadG family type IV pilus assembly protein [Pseudomonadota bacterium]